MAIMVVVNKLSYICPNLIQFLRGTSASAVNGVTLTLCSVSRASSIRQRRRTSSPKKEGAEIMSRKCAEKRRRAENGNMGGKSFPNLNGTMRLHLSCLFTSFLRFVVIRATTLLQKSEGNVHRALKTFQTGHVEQLLYHRFSWCWPTFPLTRSKVSCDDLFFCIQGVEFHPVGCDFGTPLHPRPRLFFAVAAWDSKCANSSLFLYNAGRLNYHGTGEIRTLWTGLVRKIREMADLGLEFRTICLRLGGLACGHHASLHDVDQLFFSLCGFNWGKSLLLFGFGLWIKSKLPGFIFTNEVDEIFIST